MYAFGTDELLRHADLALYVAKDEGKGRWRRYRPSLHVSLVHRMELRASLEQADVENDFVVEYQPIVELATGSAVGLEALLRWRHPTLGLLRPDQFIDVAEETGLIESIGDCRRAAHRTSVSTCRPGSSARPGSSPAYGSSLSRVDYRRTR
jgi:predicted signal transduction protein with EAL and GGDEF domain